MKTKKSNLVLIIAFIFTVLSIIAVAFYIRVSLLNSINEDENRIRREIIKEKDINDILNLKDTITQGMPQEQE